MENPLISVIVPVYKVEKYLDKCVQSIVDQTYKNLEIILVDDGSPDNCPQMCDEWAKKDSRIKVIHKENGGQSSARNRGLAVASGDLLGFVDSDDWIALDLFERVVNIFNTYEPDIVEFDANCVNSNGEIYTSTEKIKEGMLSTEEALNELLMDNINNYVWNKVFKREVFAGVRFPEGRILEDMAIMPRLFLNSEKIYCSCEKLYYYYQRSDSSLHTTGIKEIGDLFLARYERYIALKNNKYPKAEKLSLDHATTTALQVYSISLWRKKVDKSIVASAKQFLAEHKEYILKNNPSLTYRLYYRARGIYAVLYVLKRESGKILRFIRTRIKKTMSRHVNGFCKI